MWLTFPLCKMHLQTPTLAGQLRKIDPKTGEISDEPFEFEVFKDHAKNQAHYEKLADVSCPCTCSCCLAFLLFFVASFSNFSLFLIACIYFFSVFFIYFECSKSQKLFMICWSRMV